MQRFLFLVALSLCYFASLKTQTTKTEIAAELQKVISAIEIYHPDAYHYADSTKIAALREELVSELPEEPTKMQAYRAANRLVCAFGDGHTRLWDTENSSLYRENGGTYLPLGVNVRNERLFVSADHRHQPNDLTGTEITSINGIPAKELVQKLVTHASRETYDLDQVLLSSNFPRYLWLAYGEDFNQQFSLELTSNSQQTSQTISGLTYDQIATNQPAYSEPATFTTEMMDGNTAYLKITHFEARPKDFARQFKSIFRDFKAAGAHDLILDLRGHGGGDSRIGEELARYFADAPFRSFAYQEWKATPQFKQAFKNAYLPGAFHWAVPLLKGINPHLKAIYSTADHGIARVIMPETKPYGNNRQLTGRVILLMDENTFSAGTCFAAMFKDYGMGTIVGRQSGNLANFHADGLLRMSLPLAGAQLQISNSYLVRPSGDETAKPVQPDVFVDVKEDALKVALELLANDRVLGNLK
ncbi:hypothetical protein CEQ90_12305 [Lewinellaceae bacterium SD302]|nr:hypothetical protein CEQ90_12305 [Lewinellaceae bacterium SD302]